jgi:hypothetical protein
LFVVFPILGLLPLLRRLLAPWFCSLLLLLRLFAPLLYSLLLLLLLALLLMLWLSLLPSCLVSSLLLHALILPLLILLDSLLLLILPLVYPLLLALGLLLMPVISGHRRRTVGTRNISRCHCTWRAIISLSLFLHPLLILGALTWAICLWIIFRTLTWTIRLLILPRLYVTMIAALVSGRSVCWRIVGSTGFASWHALFEIFGPWSGCDRRSAVIDGCPLLPITASELAMLSLIRYGREMSLTRERLLLTRRTRGDSAVAAVVADVVHRCAIDDGGVVDVVNVGDVHIVH